MKRNGKKWLLPWATILSSCGILAAVTGGCTDTVNKMSVSGISIKAAVSIDGTRCIGCAARPCFESCPQRAIDEKVIEQQYIYIIDPEKCSGCGVCINKCPYNAIVWKR